MFKKSSNVPPDGVTPIADSVPNVNYFEFGTKFVRNL